MAAGWQLAAALMAAVTAKIQSTVKCYSNLHTVFDVTCDTAEQGCCGNSFLGVSGVCEKWQEVAVQLQ